MSEKQAVFINGARTGYHPTQCYSTMTVGQLIDVLSEYDEEAEVYLRNDNGYSYGGIDEEDVYGGSYDENDVFIDE